MAGKLVSLQIGMPRDQQLGDKNRTYVTGINKSPVLGKVWLGQLNLNGDGQGDLVHHGGREKAVCVYPSEHYPFWQEHLELPLLTSGSFGENFTTSQLTETNVCIGDIWQVGQAIVQVSQPRRPCWKLAQRWGFRDLALSVQNTGKTGWYVRTITEGYVEAGESLTLLERIAPEWTIQAANHLMYHDTNNYAAADALAEIEVLSDNWRKSLRRRVEKKQEADERSRLHGP